jgi:hypothetical protein
VRAASQYDCCLPGSAIVGSKTSRHFAQPFDVSDPRDVFSIIPKDHGHHLVVFQEERMSYM